VTDGFELGGFSLTPTDDVLVLGQLLRAGRPVAALVLRNRPVKQPPALP
jgi:hypothetical protein